ncbi:MAG TPA: 3'-5' exonuclease [Opitutaceae bacterium]|jgi:DNA polymerase-3 subunit epsilon|nr:3'-5' exonuclease [Opitutaceae bacterium]
MRWLEQPIFFIDFEGSRASGVLEYGVVTLLGGRVTETKTRLCGATGRIRPEDTAVHGLSAEAVAAHRPLAGDWEYFAGLREKGPLAAHYAGVENGLLKSVWPFPRSSPDFARPGKAALEWGPWIDSARLYAQLGSASASAKLEALVAAHGLQAELDALAAQHCPAGRRNYHGALYDALAGALLLGALARDARCADFTLIQLFALSTLDGGKRDALTQRQLW